jgi:hypothetical protein
MSSAIEAAVAHFTSMSETPRSFTVPEWGDLVVYVKPLNLKQRAAIGKEHRTDTAGAVATTIIAGAMDRDGNPLFTKEDKPKLKMHVDSNVAARVADEILGKDDEEVPSGDDPEGN